MRPSAELVSAVRALRPEVRERSYPVVLSDEGLSPTAVRARSIERLGVPARVILQGPAQLLRDAARYITGQMILVDGGASIFTPIG